MIEQELRDLFDGFSKKAQSTFEKWGFLQNLIFVLGEQTAIVPVVENKVMTEVAVKAFLVSLKAVAAIEVGEMWALKVKGPDEIPSGQIKDHPDSEEMVYVALHSRTLMLSRMWLIKTDATTGKRMLGDVEDGGRYSSRFVGDFFKRGDAHA